MSGKTIIRLDVKSPAFVHGDFIPARYARDGDNLSPFISWEGAPADTRSLVVTMETPDIPLRQLPVFSRTHWIVYNIPAEITSLPEAIPDRVRLDSGGTQGISHFKRTGYRGPSSTRGIHRYFFIVYAIDRILDVRPTEATKRRIAKAIRGHILAKGVLMGKYRRCRDISK